MTSQRRDGPPRQVGDPDTPARHRGHGWMMIACCIPVIVIFGALWLAGVIPASFLLVALACTAMMALMMVGMSYGGDQGGDQAGRENRP